MVRRRAQDPRVVDPKPALVTFKESILEQGVYTNRPFSYSMKESGSSDIFIHFYRRGSTELC